MDSHDNAQKPNPLDQTIMMSKVKELDVVSDELGETTVIHSLKTVDPASKGDQDPMAPKKKKKDWSYYVIIGCLIAIAIPSLWIGYISIRARMDRGRPLTGHRFDGDHTPEITKEGIKELQTLVEGVDGVKEAQVTLVTSTLRVYVVVNEGTAKESYPTIAGALEAAIYKKFPQAEYFQLEDNLKKMYDYDISVLSAWKKPKDDAPWTIYSLVKGSATDASLGQFLSDQASPELVKELLKAQEELNKPKKEAADE